MDPEATQEEQVIPEPAAALDPDLTETQVEQDVPLMRGQRDEQVHHRRAPREAWLFVDNLVELERVEFDLAAEAGQIRSIDEDLLKQKRLDFLAQEPLGPIRCILASQDISSMFVCV